MGDEDRVVGMVVPEDGGRVLTLSEQGYGKRTAVEEFPTKGRGTQGVIAMQTSERNGALVGAVQVMDGEEIMLITDQGTMVRTGVDEVSVLSRNTQGVRLIRLKPNEQLSGLERIEESEDDDEDSAEASAETPAQSPDEAPSDSE